MKEYQIEKLDIKKWKGTPLPVSYISNFYYDIIINKEEEGFNINIKKKRFDKPFTHVPEDGDYPDKLYENWWENAEAYGIIDGDKLLGAIELCEEEWSHRMMVTELFVDESIRNRGYGRKLMELAIKISKERKCRALMLETQSSNVNAVDFYLHMGFKLIGFDTCCYTNKDIERKEVRFNMGLFLE